MHSSWRKSICQWRLLLSLLSTLSTIAATSDNSTKADASPFLIILDGGSTGSRLHVFEFVEAPDNDSAVPSSSASSSGGGLEIHRRGSARTDGPLSGFARTDTQRRQGIPVDKAALADHFMPVFAYAASSEVGIPSQYLAKTRVLYQATAGMRLLPQNEQEAVYDAIYEGLMQRPDFPFKGLQRDDIATLSGELEGLYGAIAANYLKGIINAQLHIADGGGDESDDEAEYAGPLGALDMGGASTQIVFLPESSLEDAPMDMAAQPHYQHGYEHDNDAHSCLATDVHENDDVTAPSCGAALQASPSVKATDPTQQRHQQQQQQQQVLQGQDFFSTSYLSYGVDHFRERLWTTWVSEHEQQQLQQTDSDDACDAKLLENPCANPGFVVEWDGYTFVGTGNASACVKEIRRLIPHSEELHDEDHDDDGSTLRQLGRVGGIPHPPIRGKFVGMSLYYFSLDALRGLSNYAPLEASWPTPSIIDLANALEGLCSRDWHDDLKGDQSHRFTREAVLPHRCFEASYMVTLLRDGFGFAPESRDITFTYLVDGSEVEWSLGMALALQSEAAADGNRAHDDAPELSNPTTSRILPSYRRIDEAGSEARSLNLPVEHGTHNGATAEDYVSDHYWFPAQFVSAASTNS